MRRREGGKDYEIAIPSVASAAVATCWGIKYRLERSFEAD
jgi:hypothetical protein